MIFSFSVFTPETKESSHISNNNEPQNEEYSQDYLDQNDYRYEWTTNKEISSQN